MKGRWILLMALIVIVMMCFAGPALADTAKPVDLYFDNQPVELDAFVVDGRTIVPVRFISEKLGAEVKWDGETQTISIRGFGKDIQLYIGKQYAVVNGDTVTLDAAPVVSAGVTRVPVRFVSKTLGAIVKWDGRAVRIFSSPEAEAKALADSEPEKPDKSIPDDLDPKLKEILKNVDGVVCEYGTIYYSPKGNAGMYSPDNTILIRKGIKTYEVLVEKFDGNTYDEKTKEVIRKMLIPFYPDSYEQSYNRMLGVIEHGIDYRDYYDGRYFSCYERTHIAMHLGFDGVKY